MRCGPTCLGVRMGAGGVSCVTTAPGTPPGSRTTSRPSISTLPATSVASVTSFAAPKTPWNVMFLDTTTNSEIHKHVSRNYCLDLTEMIKDHMTREEDGSWTCGLCGFHSPYYTTMTNHIEAKHLPSVMGYTCPICQKHCPTKNALKCHKYNAHSKQK